MVRVTVDANAWICPLRDVSGVVPPARFAGSTAHGMGSRPLDRPVGIHDEAATQLHCGFTPLLLFICSKGNRNTAAQSRRDFV